MMGLSDGRKNVRIGLADLIQCRSVTDSQLPSQPDTLPYLLPRLLHRAGNDNCASQISRLPADAHCSGRRFLPYGKQYDVMWAGFVYKTWIPIVPPTVIRCSVIGRRRLAGRSDRLDVVSIRFDSRIGSRTKSNIRPSVPPSVRRSDEAFTRYDRRTDQSDRPVGPTGRSDDRNV